MMIDQSGQQIGSYRLVRRLGFGGFASVYLGQHMRIATQQAAIKLLYLVDVDSKKFQEEAETTAALVHPNIIRLFDFDFHNQMPFLVIDYAPGGSLRSRHPAGTPIPLSTVVQYVQEIAKALEYAHSKNVIHRDIKPDNILIGGQGELQLSDFGIAVLSQTGRTTLAATSGTGGTAYYMAPEQSRGKPEKASDQYALGIMVYEWLCGKPPFSEGNAINIQYQHAYEPVPTLCEQLPTFPSAVEQVIMCALAKNPRERFATVQEFATALTEACTLRVSSPIVPSVPVPPVQKREASTPAYVSSPSLLSPAMPPVQKKPKWMLFFPTSSLFVSPPTELIVQERPMGTLLFTCKGHITAVYAIAWSLDGRCVASASTDSTVRLWDTRSGQLLHTCIGHTDYVGSVAWSLDGRYVASASDDMTVRLWDASSALCLYVCKGHSNAVRAVAWSPDGRRVASASEDTTVRLWDGRSGQLQYTCTGHTDIVMAVAWSSDGRHVASASWDGTVRLWDAKSGELQHTCIHTDGVYEVAWSLDGSHVVSVSHDTTVRLWNAKSGELQHIWGHTDIVVAAAWSPDGKRVASASFDKTVRLWDVCSGELQHVCIGHIDAVRSVAWSPDGRWVASASDDKTVRLWDTGTGELLYTCKGHTNAVYAVAWSPDGSILTSGSYDKTVRLWQGA